MKDTVLTTWEGDLVFKSLNPNESTLMHGSVSDDSKKISGPKILMLSSLAGCSGLDVISILDKMKIKLDDFKIAIVCRMSSKNMRSNSTNSRMISKFI